ncbi:unnamed protein product [Caenorhabditis sp. 36 PRJEB53466]|nr:unnamed protein product [Caenorhabditis sp. 36 PRJEB53466]
MSSFPEPLDTGNDSGIVEDANASKIKCDSSEVTVTSVAALMAGNSEQATVTYVKPEDVTLMIKSLALSPRTDKDGEVKSEKKFHGFRKNASALDMSSFGAHLGAFGYGAGKRGDGSCHSILESEGSSSKDSSFARNNSEPCSSAQADARDTLQEATDLADRQSDLAASVPLLPGGIRVVRNFIHFFTKDNYGYMLVDMAWAGTDSFFETFSVPCLPSLFSFLSSRFHTQLSAPPTPAYARTCTAQLSQNPDKYFRESSWLKKKMPILFGKSHKSPAEVVKTLREALIIVDRANIPKKNYDRALEEVSKNVAMIKAFIYGNDQTEPTSEHVVQVAQLAQEVYNANVLPMLIKMLPKFEFECKKDVASIFNNLLRRQIGTRSPTVEYLGARPEILLQLVQGYSVQDIALVSGLMLRESIRHDHLAKIILYSDVFYTFFGYVQSEVFDIASDAFSTFKDLTTRHKALSAEFLDANYDIFFENYQCLLNSKNYVTRRQSLKLLGELLLDRHNFNTMTKYISNPENLKLMMELLRDKSRNIQYEAFHVFKVFVANPNKPKQISDILLRNREKLVEFLGEFHNDRTDDEQFNDEKAYLIKQIQEMKGAPKESKKKNKEGDQPGPSGPPPPPAVEQK